MNNIYLKGAIPEDFEEYYRIRCNPSDIYWNGYVGKPEKTQFHNLFLHRTFLTPFVSPGDKHIYLIMLASEDLKLPIGFIQFIRHEREIEIGYGVQEEHQGKGYGTAALKAALQIAIQYSERIIVSIRDDNIASIKIAENNGFIPTGKYNVINRGAGIIAEQLYELQLKQPDC